MDKYQTYLRQKPDAMQNAMERTYLNMKDAKALKLSSSVIDEVGTEIDKYGVKSKAEMYGDVWKNSFKEFMHSDAREGFETAMDQAKARGQELSFSSRLTTGAAVPLEAGYDALAGLLNGVVGLFAPGIGGQRQGANDHRAPSKTQKMLQEVAAGFDQSAMAVGQLQGAVTLPLDILESFVEDNVNWQLSEQVNQANQAKIGEGLIDILAIPIGGAAIKTGAKVASGGARASSMSIAKALAGAPAKNLQKMANKFGMNPQFLKDFISKHAEKFHINVDGEILMLPEGPRTLLLPERTEGIVLGDKGGVMVTEPRPPGPVGGVIMNTDGAGASIDISSKFSQAKVLANEGGVMQGEAIVVSPQRMKADIELSAFDEHIQSARTAVAEAPTPQAAKVAQRKVMALEAMQEMTIRKAGAALIQKIDDAPVMQGAIKIANNLVKGLGDLKSATVDSFMAMKQSERLADLIKAVGESPKDFLDKVSTNGKINPERLSAEVSRITQKAGTQLSRKAEELQARALDANPVGAYNFVYKKFGNYSPNDILRDLQNALAGGKTRFSDLQKSAESVASEAVSRVGQAEYDIAMKFGGFFGAEKTKKFLDSIGTDKAREAAGDLYQAVGNSDIVKALEGAVSKTLAGKLAGGSARVKSAIDETKEVLANVYKTKDAKAKAATSIIKEKGDQLGEAGANFYTLIANKVNIGKAEIDEISAAAAREYLSKMANGIRERITSLPTGTPDAIRSGSASVMNSFGVATTKVYATIQSGDIQKMIATHYKKVKESLPTIDRDGDGAVESITQQLGATQVDEVVMGFIQDVVTKEVTKVVDSVPAPVKKDVQEIVQPLMEQAMEDVRDFGRAKLGNGTIAQVYGDDAVNRLVKPPRVNPKVSAKKVSKDSLEMNEDIDLIESRDKMQLEKGRPDAKERPDGFSDKDDYDVEKSLGKNKPLDNEREADGPKKLRPVFKPQFEKYRKRTVDSITSKAKEVDGVVAKTNSAEEAAVKIANNQKAVLRIVKDFETNTKSSKKLIATNKFYSTQIQKEKAAGFKKFGEKFQEEYNKAIGRFDATKEMGDVEPTPWALKKIETAGLTKKEIEILNNLNKKNKPNVVSPNKRK